MGSDIDDEELAESIGIDAKYIQQALEQSEFCPNEGQD